MKVLALIVLLIAYTTAVCIDGSEPEPQDLNYCAHYSDSTCCLPNEEPQEDDSGSENPCEKTSAGCLEQIKLLLCSFCSPDIGDFNIAQNISGNIIQGDTRICPDFADRIYDSCKDDEILIAVDECGLVGEQWSNSEDFINAFIIYRYGGEPCFTDGEPSSTASEPTSTADESSNSEIIKPLTVLATFLYALFVF